MKTIKILFFSLCWIQLGFSQSQAYELEMTFPNTTIQNQTDFRAYSGFNLSCGVAYNSVTYIYGVWATKSTENSVVWTKFITPNDPSEYPSSINISKLNTSEDIILSYLVSNSGMNYMIVSRLDGTTGSIIWSKKLDYTDTNSGSEYLNINKLSVSTIDEIMITASMYSSMQVVKLTSSGGLIFSKKISNFTDDFGKSPGFAFIATSDGGYIGTFKRDSNPTIVKLAPDLSVEWTQLWSFESYSHPRCAIELDNGKYAISGTGDFGNFLAILANNGTMESYKTLPYAFNYFEVTQLKQLNPTTLFIGCANGYFMIDLNSNSYQEHSLADMQFGTINFDTENNQIHFYGNLPSNLKMPFMLNLDLINPTCIEHSVITNTMNPVTIPSQLSDVDFYFEANGILTDFNPVAISGQGTITEACFLGIDDQNETFFSVSPNPAIAGTSISITFENVPQAGESIEIIDLAGRIYQQFNDLNQTTTVVLNSTLTNGVYLLKHYEASGQLLSTSKLIVQ